LIEFEKALNYYEKEGLAEKVAAIEVNIGVMHNIVGNEIEAEASWGKALQINRSIGNLNSEGTLLLNNGVHYFEQLNFDKAIEYYKRAHTIFLSLGSKSKEGLVLSNLGEIYYTTCEYQNAIDALDEAKLIFSKADNLEELIPLLLLLGYIHFTIGNIKELNDLNDQLSTLLNNSQTQEKYKSEKILLNYLQLILDGKEIQISELEMVRNDFLEKEDFKNYVAVNTILLNYFINLNLFSKAEEELINLSFIEVCSKNNLYSANREYLLGKVALLHNSDNSSSPIEHFEKAYEFLSNESIVELTWKVLFALAETYTERGNFNKAKNFIIYARDIIYLIAENIETTQFKTAYLQKEERRAAIEILEKLHSDKGAL